MARACWPACEPGDHVFLQLPDSSQLIEAFLGAMLLANVRDPCRASESRHDDSMVTWLSFYHDMGLVGKLLFAIGLRSDLHVLPPETFLARPRTWLQPRVDLFQGCR